MADILLSTLNARYIHSALGLRYLYANLAEMQGDARIMEFTIHERPIDIAEKLLAENPRIIALGVYIWNIQQSTELVAMLKTIRPEIKIILGGPEVSYETQQQPISQYADLVICGQGDIEFARQCRSLLNGKPILQKVIQAAAFPLADLQMPYHLYDDEDVKNRVIYVEASRGCPYKCAFCLSALDKTAYAFDINLFLGHMQTLYERGVRHFKFVDRTFNLKIDTCKHILNFFLERMDDDLFLHFELIPDHLPDELKTLIKKFPAGQLQFEIGIQTFNIDTQKLIKRRQDNDKAVANILWLREQSSAHLHTDLILGLPGEDLDSIEAGFNRLYALKPHEIQVGILKRLRGSPITALSDAHQMQYSPLPPYNILANDKLDFAIIQRLNRFARFWDMLANSGRFALSLPLLIDTNPFARFMQLSDWLYKVTDQTHRLALPRQFQLLYRAADELFKLKDDEFHQTMLQDYERSGLKGMPSFLRDDRQKNIKSTKAASQRQQRHQ